MDDPRHEAEQRDGRLLFRFSVGAVALGGEWLVEELRSWDRAIREEGRVEGLETDHRARHRMIGALAMAPGYAVEAAQRVRSAYDRSAGRLLEPLRERWVRTTPGRRLQARAHALRERLEAEAATWEVVGRVEEREGRALAETGLEALSETFFQRLAQNPELRGLIAEQSAGLTRTLLKEAREIGATADSRVESAIRRFLRRPPRAVEPLPAGE